MTRLLLVFAAMLGACSNEPVFDAQILGGQEVSGEVLDLGHRVYRRYCSSCHGDNGNGRGPSATGMWPAPRDFQIAKFKFAGIQDRGLPADSELRRIVQHGLAGTSMRAWDVEADELNAVIHYIKTFSKEDKGFRKKSLNVKTPHIASEPPLSAERIEKGSTLYHSVFQCSSCHPTYVDSATLMSLGMQLRENANTSIPKWSSDYRAVLVPPDFAKHPMRAIRFELTEGRRNYNLSDIYRTVAYGLQGPMPGYLHLGEEDVWSVAMYVKSMLDKSDRATSPLTF